MISTSLAFTKKRIKIPSIHTIIKCDQPCGASTHLMTANQAQLQHIRQSKAHTNSSGQGARKLVTISCGLTTHFLGAVCFIVIRSGWFGILVRAVFERNFWKPNTSRLSRTRHAFYFLASGAPHFNQSSPRSYRMQSECFGRNNYVDTQSYLLCVWNIRRPNRIKDARTWWRLMIRILCENANGATQWGLTDLHCGSFDEDRCVSFFGEAIIQILYQHLTSRARTTRGIRAGHRWLGSCARIAHEVVDWDFIKTKFDFK